MNPVRPASTTTKVATRCLVPRLCATRSSSIASSPRRGPCCQRFQVESPKALKKWRVDGSRILNRARSGQAVRIECGTHRGFRTSLGRGDPCTQYKWQNGEEALLL